MGLPETKEKLAKLLTTGFFISSAGILACQPTGAQIELPINNVPTIPELDTDPCVQPTSFNDRGLALYDGRLLNYFAIDGVRKIVYLRDIVSRILNLEGAIKYSYKDNDAILLDYTTKRQPREKNYPPTPDNYHLNLGVPKKVYRWNFKFVGGNPNHNDDQVYNVNTFYRNCEREMSELVITGTLRPFMDRAGMIVRDGTLKQTAQFHINFSPDTKWLPGLVDYNGRLIPAISAYDPVNHLDLSLDSNRNMTLIAHGPFQTSSASYKP